MSSKDLSGWVQDWGPLIALVSAVLLTLVTAWLAWVTMRMAKGAKDAAEYSKTAAQASLASAAAMQASVSVEFTLSPVAVTSLGKVVDFLKDEVAKGFLRGDEEADLRMLDSIVAIKEITLGCDGSAVYIHGALVTEICQEAARWDTIECRATNTVLAEASVALPYRLHKGESLSFNVAGFQPGERVVRITAIIDYSFDGQNDVHQRLVVWRDRPRKGTTIKGIEMHDLTKHDDTQIGHGK
jgi:hypothetical protein